MEATLIYNFSNPSGTLHRELAGLEKIEKIVRRMLLLDVIYEFFSTTAIKLHNIWTS